MGFCVYYLVDIEGDRRFSRSRRSPLLFSEIFQLTDSLQPDFGVERPTGGQYSAIHLQWDVQKAWRAIPPNPVIATNSIVAVSADWIKSYMVLFLVFGVRAWCVAVALPRAYTQYSYQPTQCQCKRLASYVKIM